MDLCFNKDFDMYATFIKIKNFKNLNILQTKFIPNYWHIIITTNTQQIFATKYIYNTFFVGKI